MLKKRREPVVFERPKKRRRLRKKKREEIVTEIIRAKEIPKARIGKIPVIPAFREEVDLVRLQTAKDKTLALLKDIKSQEEAFKASQLLLAEQEKRLAQEEISFIQRFEEQLSETLLEIQDIMQQSEDEELLMLLL